MIILDLFCGEGGVAEGLKRAAPGAMIIGIDTDAAALRYYPGLGRCMSWEEGIERYGKRVHFIWASPPCQGYTGQYGDTVSKKPRLIGPVREALISCNTPFVIENVSGAAADLIDPVALVGDMYGLEAWFAPTPNARYNPRGDSKCKPDTWLCGDWPDAIQLKLTRKRLFEAHEFKIRPPEYTRSSLPSLTVLNGSDTAGFHRLGHRDPRVDECMNIMGIRHPMTKHGVAEAIPPAYAEQVLRDFLDSDQTIR